MNGHRLRRQFHAAGNAETAMCAQRMIGARCPPLRQLIRSRIPVDDFVEQAHAAAVRDVRLDPGAIQVHGSTRTAVLDPSR